MSTSKSLVFVSVLATIVIPFVLTSWLLSLSIRTHYGGIVVVSPKRLLAALSIPTAIAVREFYRKNLSYSGIVAAFAVGFITTMANACFIVSIFVFFFTSSKLTRFRAERKARQDEESSSGVQRTWLNVLHSGGIPTAVSLLYMIEVGCHETRIDFEDPLLHISSWLSISVLGSVACACGDTWASEVGSAVGDNTSRLITTGKIVPAGTNGGVTLVGTLASAVGGAIIGFSFSLTNHLTTDSVSFQWSLMWIGMISGLSGSMLDSVLGATLQYSGFNEDTKMVVSKPGPGVKHISGVNFINNHFVNMISTCITSWTAPLLYQILIDWLI